MKKNIKILCAAVCGLLLVLIITAVVCRQLAKPVSNKENETSVRVLIHAGMSVKAASSELYARKVIRNADVFYAAARFPFLRPVLLGRAVPFTLKSGVYTIRTSMSMADIFTLLSSGHQEYIRVVIPEGLTISKIAERLESMHVCAADDFKNAAHSDELLKKYKIPAKSFEGYLFPDTYFMTPGMTGKAAVSIMADTFFSKIKTIPALASASSAKLNETVILASIVEREYRIDSEAPLIASVFSNRMKKHIGLYSCATIEYIITEIEGKPHPDIITYADLQIKNPYNTYKWAGLTPGPISNPGIVALSAAADPPRTNYYYFRLIDPETGHHAFSSNFSTHISEGHKQYTLKAGR